MHNARSVFRSHIVSGNDTEGFILPAHYLAVHYLTRFHPRHELLVVQADDVRAFASPYHVIFYRVSLSVFLREIRLAP